MKKRRLSDQEKNSLQQPERNAQPGASPERILRPVSWSRRGFLKAGSLSAAGLGIAACAGDLSRLQQRIEITTDDPTFNATIAGHGTNPVTIVLKAKATLTANLTIPENIQLIVQRGEKIGSTYTTGRIDLDGYKLTMSGQFEAASFQVFYYNSAAHAFGESEGVSFSQDSCDRVNVLWFGADPTNTNDSTYPIQRAIDAAVGVPKVFVPAGHYKVTDTIHLAKNSGSGFIPFTSRSLEGEPRKENQVHNSTLEFVRKEAETENRDRPLLNLQFVRRSSLKHLKLLGTNAKVAEEATGTKSPDQDDWFDSGVSVGRYNPFCAIATDAFVKNPDHVISGSTLYTETSSRGVVYSETGSGSSTLLIEDIYIDGFGVGLMVAPGGANQNDIYTIRQCHFTKCTYGVAIGSTQARGVQIKNSNFNSNYVAVDTMTFGSQLGSNINLDTNIYTQIRVLYQFAAGTGGSLHISGEHCENVMRLARFGHLGSQSATDIAAFTGCHFALAASTSTETKLYSLGALIDGNTAVHFRSCHFKLWEQSNLTVHTNGSLASRVLFESCNFQIAPTNSSSLGIPNILLAASTSAAYVDNARHTVSFKNSFFAGSSSSYNHPLDDILPVPLATQSSPIRQPIHWSTKGLRVTGGTYKDQTIRIKNTHNNLGYFPNLDLKYSHSTTNSGVTTYHFTATHPQNILEGQHQVGDLIYIATKYVSDEVGETTVAARDLPVLKIKTTSYAYDGVNSQYTATITAERAELDSSYVSDFTVEPNTSNTAHYIYLRTNFTDEDDSQFYVILNGSVTGNITAGSHTVTNVTNIGLLQVGDFLNENYFGSTTRIKSINTGSNEITTSRHASVTATGINLPMMQLLDT